MTLPGWLRRLLGFAAESAVDAVTRRLNEVRNDDTPRELPPIDVGEKVRKVPRPPPRGIK